ncbi:hypothetical protein HFO56_03040 [Rhizobium laguerreae]|uniref:hypothetical protein n=1 Tax=Rhizobium laguerreae TaxID=1076926 RepID=UPI001C8FC81F|nr:hypothetical protein [Rhizobium laguerreae]MBY3151363.1 hypothetical protein [Rhizobium laguerreae]
MPFSGSIRRKVCVDLKTRVRVRRDRIALDSAAAYSLARWLGSDTWEAYVAKKGSVLSPLDQDVDDAERHQRREHFISVLCSDGYSRADAEIVVDGVRPSGAMKKSKPTAHQSASSETILDLLSDAYSVGDFDEAAGLFSLIMDSESAVPDGLLSVLEQHIDLDPRALHHMAIVHISRRVAQNSGKARKLLLEQMKRFPEDDRRGWILSLLGDIASGVYGGTLNQREALDYYVNATDLDVGPAATNAAIIYGRNPELNDPAKAEEFYLHAVRLGVPEAKTNLASLEELFGRKRSTLFVHGWEIARAVRIRGLGVRFLSAILEALKPSFGGFGSVAVGVQPMQFAADGVSEVAQYKAACSSLRNYLVQSGGNTGSIEGAKLISQDIPLGGLGEAGLMVGLAMNIR